MKNLNTKKINERFLAYQCLYDVFYKNAYTNLSLQKTFRINKLPSNDKALLTELVYGICRKYNYLKHIIEKTSNRSINKINKNVLILLFIGLYQLLYLDKIPESAAVNETVKITKKITHSGNVKFVNAILRNFLRKKEELQDLTYIKDEKILLSITFNQPIWLIEKWIKDYGYDKTEEILKAFDSHERLFIRCNELKIKPDKLEQILINKNIEYENVKDFNNAFSIKNGGSLFKTDLLKKGYIFIQSLSSMMPVYVLDPKENEVILDMCAAPGSKATQIAQFMKNKGYVEAWDLYPHKIELIKENLKKLGITIVEPKVRDSTELIQTLSEKYDKILLDAPCSGLGVLGHKPELRWRRTQKDINELIDIQKNLLNCASVYIKKGGILVYSTCTLNVEENEKIVEWFLKNNFNFCLEPIKINDTLNSDTGMITLWPNTLNSDGFFMAKLKRK